MCCTCLDLAELQGPAFRVQRSCATDSKLAPRLAAGTCQYGRCGQYGERRIFSGSTLCIWAGTRQVETYDVTTQHRHSSKASFLVTSAHTSSVPYKLHHPSFCSIPLLNQVIHAQIGHLFALFRLYITFQPLVPPVSLSGCNRRQDAPDDGPRSPGLSSRRWQESHSPEREREATDAPGWRPISPRVIVHLPF